MTEDPASKFSVLVVDDNSVNRMVLKQIVEMLGGNVSTAEDGAQAVLAATSQTFDLILMDLAMPVMDGLDATRNLREYGLTCPIVAVTAHMQGSDEGTLRAHGLDGLIAKPISVAAVAATIERVGDMTNVVAVIPDTRRAGQG